MHPRNWQGFQWQWWGFQIYLNQATTLRFESTIHVAADVGGLIGAVCGASGQVYCGWIGAMIWAFGSLLADYMSWVDRGYGVIWNVALWLGFVWWWSGQ
jgi:hypothetical protein